MKPCNPLRANGLHLLPSVPTLRELAQMVGRMRYSPAAAVDLRLAAFRQCLAAGSTFFENPGTVMALFLVNRPLALNLI